MPDGDENMPAQVLEEALVVPEIGPMGQDWQSENPHVFGDDLVITWDDTSLDGVKSVGDSARDLDAARAAGADPILVRSGNGRQTEAELAGEDIVPVFDDLAAFVAHYLDA